MKIIQSDILIIGGGLTGLAIAYFLKDQNISVHIIEARERLGGRIHTEHNENTTTQEMGATWLGRKHTYLNALLKELNIGIFEQMLGRTAIYEPISTSPHQIVTLPPNTDPSYRIKDGTSTLIKALANHLNLEQIYLNQAVESIEVQEDGVLVKSSTHEFKAAKVISTLPPNLLTQTIDIQPNLSSELTNIAKNTHTWMGESIKVGLTYKTPFWREKHLSGTIVSNVGAIPEMYDHSNHQDNLYGLKGFLNGSYYSVTREVRLELVMKQLQKYYGEQARDFVTYKETVWRNEPYTFAPYSNHILPHQNNGHSVYQKAYLDGKLFVAGSETATQFPGYMEGAIRSAKWVCDNLDKKK